MTSTASTDWPRAYLLQIHAQAVAHGLIFLEKISEVDAKSLKQRLYRIRRRSDKSTATFVPPEYHLVTVGKYQPMEGPDAPGRLPIIYSSLPDGKALPHIRAATPEEIANAIPLPPIQAPLTPLTPEVLLQNLEHTDMTLKPEEVDSFVADLMKSAKKRSGGDDDED